MAELAWKETNELKVMAVKIGNKEFYKIITNKQMKNMPKSMQLMIESSDGFVSNHQPRFNWNEPGNDAPVPKKKSTMKVSEPGPSQQRISSPRFQRIVPLGEREPFTVEIRTKPKRVNCDIFFFATKKQCKLPAKPILHFCVW